MQVKTIPHAKNRSVFSPQLIAIEGADGSGKSTQARMLADRIDAALTRQPGGTEFGERLREIILHKSSHVLLPQTEAMLFMADRAEHVDKMVRPVLASGRSVVSDRWAYSSLVYQGYGRGLDIDVLRHLSDWAMNGLWPDVVVLLDLPLDVAHARQRSRSELDHYEAEGQRLQSDVMRGYRELAAADPQRWRVVDASGSVDEVHARVCSILKIS